MNTSKMNLYKTYFLLRQFGVVIMASWHHSIIYQQISVPSAALDPHGVSPRNDGLLLGSWCQHSVMSRTISSRPLTPRWSMEVRSGLSPWGIRKRTRLDRAPAGQTGVRRAADASQRALRDTYLHTAPSRWPWTTAERRNCRADRTHFITHYTSCLDCLRLWTSCVPFA